MSDTVQDSKPSSGLENQDGPTPKRRKYLKPRLRHKESDLSLWKTKSFADATILCDGKEIQVHKSIICTRSSYFHGALAGGFMESHTNQVQISDFTVKQMESTIYFMYAGEFENKDSLSMADCVEMIKLGDYFLVDGMVESAARMLWARLSSRLMDASQCWEPLVTKAGQPTPDHFKGLQHPRVTLQDNDFVAGFQEAVHAAYKIHVAADDIAQKILADFVFAASVALLGSPWIESLNNAYPEFGSQVFTVMNQGLQSGFIHKRGQAGVNCSPPRNIVASKACADCTRSWGVSRFPKLYDPASLELCATRAFCPECADSKTRCGKTWKSGL